MAEQLVGLTLQQIKVIMRMSMHTFWKNRAVMSIKQIVELYLLIKLCSVVHCLMEVARDDTK